MKFHVIYRYTVEAGSLDAAKAAASNAVFSSLLIRHPPQIQPLSLSQKASNLTGAAFRVAAATMKGAKVIAADSEIERRMAICHGCEYFQDNPMKCQKCSCYLNLKTRLETEHCPIQKW